MNERIHELIDQSGLVPVQEMFQEELYKFAELIVRECALALDETIAPASHPYNSIGWKLKEHFGVEE